MDSFRRPHWLSCHYRSEDGRYTGGNLTVQLRSIKLSSPRLLLIGILFVTATGLTIGAVTSSATYGPYNYDWDGTGDLRDLAHETGVEMETVGVTTEYQTTDSDQTVAFVIEPSESNSGSTAEEIHTFLEKGGDVVIASGRAKGANQLLANIGVESRFDGRPLRDAQQYYRSPALPVVEPVDETVSSEVAPQVTLNHGTAVTPSGDSTVLFQSSQFSYLDLNMNQTLDEDEPLRKYPVVVREDVANGSVMIVGDSSVFINRMLEQNGNSNFAQNLMIGSETVLLDIPAKEAVPAAAVLIPTTVEPSQMIVLLTALLSTILLLTIVRSYIETSRHTESRDAELPGSIAERLAEKHPEWGEDRIERVVDFFE